MRKNILPAKAITFFTVFVLYIITSPSIVIGAPARDASAAFGDVEGIEWVLSEVKTGGITVKIDRQKLETDGMGGFFTISFQEGRLNGIGAPNRYFGPYTAAANRTLIVGNVASTMMLAFKEPDELKESEYFDYLSKIKRWDLWEGKLELYSVNNNEDLTILIFNH